jgi:hypothetical protein
LSGEVALGAQPVGGARYRCGATHDRVSAKNALWPVGGRYENFVPLVKGALQENQKVSFEAKQGPKGLQASNIQPQ